jgi:hypothetical protein
LGFSPFATIRRQSYLALAKNVWIKPFSKSNIISLQLKQEAIQNLNEIQNLEAILKISN